MSENVKILTKAEVFKYMDLFFHDRNIRLYGEDSIHTTIGRVLIGDAFMLCVMRDDKVLSVVALMVTGHDRRTLELLQLYGRNKVKDSVDMFITWAKAQGFSRVCGITRANPQALSKILGAEIKYSYLERSL